MHKLEETGFSWWLIELCALCTLALFNIFCKGANAGYMSCSSFKNNFKIL